MGGLKTGKTFTAINTANELVRGNREGNKNNYIRFIQLNENYSYEDFVAKIEFQASDVRKESKYKFVNKVLKEICEEANQYVDNQYAIILDDAHEVNLTMILGELLYGIENRGKNLTLRDGSQIRIPNNLTIIITVSTLQEKYKVDYALLRRFKQYYITSDTRLCSFQQDSNTFWSRFYKSKLDWINKLIEYYINFQYKDEIEDYKIGHGYFINHNCHVNPYIFQRQRINYQIIPILEKYIKEGILRSETSLQSMIRMQKNIDEKTQLVNIGKKQTNASEFAKALYMVIEKLKKLRLLPDGILLMDILLTSFIEDNIYESIIEMYDIGEDKRAQKWKHRVATYGSISDKIIFDDLEFLLISRPLGFNNKKDLNERMFKLIKDVIIRYSTFPPLKSL